MYDYGYVAMTFYKRDTNNFIKIIKNICKESDLYGKKGIVAHKLHLTFLYGIIEQNLNINELKLYLKSIKLKSINLGGLKLMKVHKDFNILYVNIIDNNCDIKEIYNNLKKLPFEKSVQHDKFIPHLALAYVNPNYEIDNKIKIKIPNKLNIKDIKYFGIN